MKYILGIDPGLSGALALYNGNELKTFEMPIIKPKKGIKGKKSIDGYGLARMIDSWAKDIEFAIIEQVHSMPNQSMSSMFNFGEGYGRVKGIIEANFIPLKFVSPQTWKGNLQVSKDKNKSRERASEIFPKFSNQWCKVKWDGRAEAAMIAYYGSKLSQ